MSDYIDNLHQWANDCVKSDHASRKVRTKRSPVQVVARFMSMTTPGVSYNLTKWHDKLTCSCPGFQYKRMCKHIRAIG